jgi:hypothetical protein
VIVFELAWDADQPAFAAVTVHTITLSLRLVAYWILARGYHAQERLLRLGRRLVFLVDPRRVLAARASRASQRGSLFGLFTEAAGQGFEP